ncbi:FliH/SctL family protein [Pararhodospirillum photometricum]|nr:FliH/SctL family protein [Pararhodospirillum photometricum]
MEATREEGYIAGHAAALDEAGGANERMVVLALSEVGASLETLRTQHATSLDTLSRDVARLVYGVCRKMLPVSASDVIVAEIIALVTEALPQVLDEPRLVIRVHPDVADLVRERLEPLVAQYGYEGRVLVTADPRLGRPDCRVEWAAGGIERDCARQWEEIAEIITRHTGHAVGPIPTDAAPDEPAGP